MKRLVCVLVCVSLVLSCTSFAENVIDADIEPYVDYVSVYTRDMELGSTGEDVLFMQHRLYGLGYILSVGTGDFDSETENAVKEFQLAHASLGLSATGVADKATLNALMSENAMPARLQKGDKGEDVIKLQNALIEYGFLQGAADNYFGKETAAAVLSLQEHLIAQGVDGYGTDGTATAALQAYLYSGKYDPYIRDLSYSDTGTDVKSLYGRLSALGYTDIVGDSFDEYLKDAVKDFQKDNGLKVSGIADRETFAALYSPDAEKARTYTRRALSMGDEGDTVTQLQWALMVNGFMNGYTTGTYDKKTREALDRLKEYWLGYTDEDTNAISAQLQDRILAGEVPAFSINVEKGDKSEAVRRVQRRLNTLFYVNSNIDGVAGEKLEKAIKLFQDKNGLPESGIAGEATQTALFSYNAVSNGSKIILRVSTEDQRVYAYQRDDDGRYELVRTMICSTGKTETPTPNGIYIDYTRPQHRWHYFTEFNCWAQYTFVISGNYLFHSVLFYSKSENATNYVSVANLGKKASHGCVRLKVEDAKWVYENCEAKTVVIVHPK